MSDLADRILNADRRALARAITLVESTRADQARHWFGEEVKQALLARLETPQARDAMAKWADTVAQGKAAPASAARALLSELPADGATRS